MKLCITDRVIKALHPFTTGVPTAEDWVALDERVPEDTHGMIEEVLSQVDTGDLQDVLYQALQFAMPAILAEITRRDQHHLRGAST